MANFEQVLFILQFIVLVAVFIYKLLNILYGWTLYEWQGIIVLFVATVFLYGMNLIITPIAYDNMLLVQLSKLEILPYLVIVVLSVIESVMLINAKSRGRSRYVAVENGRQ